MKVVVFKDFHLWSNKGEKFSFKNGAFGTLDFLIDDALDEFKNKQKLLLKDLCANILKDFYLMIECQTENTKECNKTDI